MVGAFTFLGGFAVAANAGKAFGVKSDGPFSVNHLKDLTQTWVD